MVQTQMTTIAIITGPTAVGKSDVAVKVALALGGEVVGADSMQIYKGMDIGTGKITVREACGVPHHMIDVARPDEDYSVGRYVREAKAAIDDIAAREKLPIVVGGTGLYINSLLFGHSFANAPKDETVRAKLRAQAEEKGNEFIYERLKEVDPASAREINKNDAKRIIRALEIYELTGKPRSGQKDAPIPVFRYRLAVLTCEREKLYARINSRVDKMFDGGLVDEVRGLYRYKDCNSMQAIGYKEVVDFLDGKLTEDEAREAVKQNSRRYAKRQMTFFRGMKCEKTFFDVDITSETLTEYFGRML